MSAEGTTIVSRGGAEVVNQFSGTSCQPIVTDELIATLQESDARCPPPE